MTDNRKDEPQPGPSEPSKGPLHGQRDMTKPDKTKSEPAVPEDLKDKYERGGGTREK